MDTKTCPKCGDTKPVEDFAWLNKAKGKRYMYCKECKRAYENGRYANDEASRAKTKARTKARREKVREEIYDYLFEYLLAHPCPCGDDDILSLEFHHRDPSEKDDSISRLASISTSLKRVKDEVKKCDVLCAKCHQKQHPAPWKVARLRSVG